MKHYMRWKRTGDPVAMTLIRGDDEARFWSKVDKTDGCWEWLGAKTKDGHGRFRTPTSHVLAHRWAYEHLVAPIPDGLVLDHLCRNTSCVNPDHLEPVTVAENTARGIGPSAENRRKTHCPRGHAYADHAVVREGRRRCGVCG